jgi:ABC-type transport system involved in multi-copper enzyme maturation permease subunit
MGLTIGAGSLSGERERGTLQYLLAQPVNRAEVLLGKYLGIVLAAGMATAILGCVIMVATWWRIPGDYLINVNTLDDRDLKLLASYRAMHIAGLVPALVLKWFQISVLAAVSVAISTRVSLVVNLPVVIFVYIAGNLTRFLFPLDPRENFFTKAGAWVLSTFLPYLEIFDLNNATVYQKIAVAGFANDPMAIHLGAIWKYVAFAFGYAVVYVFFALVAGLLLFENRELGGAEG